MDTSLTSLAEIANNPETPRLLQELRTLIGPGHSEHSDLFLAKFLIGRGMKPQKAFDMLSTTLKWRDENKVDQMPPADCAVPNHVRGYPDIPDTDFIPPSAWNTFWPLLGGGAYHKYDKEGFPIYVELIGQTNARELASLESKDALIQYHLYNVEFLRKSVMDSCSRLVNKLIDKHVVIMDLQGLGFSHLNIKTLLILKTLADLDQAYYPELLHRLFIVNTPAIFSSIYTIIKPWVDKRTLDKVHILTSKNMAETLLKYIDAENLPLCYGGTCTCSHMSTGCIPNKKP